MRPAKPLPRTRSRARYRKLAIEGAIVSCLLAFCYVRPAIWGVSSVPFLICAAVAAILAVIGVVLPDGRAHPVVVGDYEEGRRGAVPDGRADIDFDARRQRP
jgi:hypothetical protein